MVALAPMIENKADAPEGWFLCDGCLAYHPPEYRAEYYSSSEYKKFCRFAVAIIQGEEIPVSDTPLQSISHAQDIDEKPVTLTSPIETTCDNDSVPVNVTKKNRSLRLDLPEEEIRNSTESGVVLARRYDTNKMMISRIRRGQRVLFNEEMDKDKTL